MAKAVNNDGGPLQIAEKSIETVALAAIFSPEIVPNIVEVCNGTPNPRRAMEIMLGLYEVPQIPLRCEDSKDRINHSLTNFNKWEDRVSYSYQRVDRTKMWLHNDFIADMANNGASLEEEEFFYAYEAGKIVDSYWLHDYKEEVMQYLNALPKKEGIEKKEYTLEEITNELINDEFTQVSVLKGTNEELSNDSMPLDLWLEKQPTPIRRGEEDIHA